MTANTEQKFLRLVDLREVVNVAGISKSEIFRRMKDGRFPHPVRIGDGRCTRWEFSEVQQWVRDRLAERGVVNHQSEARAA